MSAVVVWNAMDKVVTDATLHNTVKRLLFVQVGTLQNHEILFSHSHSSHYKRYFTAGCVDAVFSLQSVGVCLEKGMPSMAKDTLQWFERECDLPQVGSCSLFMNSPLLICSIHSQFSSVLFFFCVSLNLQKLQMKLASIVSRKNAYDTYLTSFSFDRLLDQIQTFLDSFLEENPSSFLIRVSKSLSCHNTAPVNFKQNFQCLPCLT